MATPAELEALIREPRELMHVEVKGWLDLVATEHKSLLAKAIIALANHGGGFVVVGFARIDGIYSEAAGRPATLGTYNDDAINGIVRSYAAPAFHCAVHLVAHPVTQVAYPVIAVPGGHRTPVQALRGSPDQRSLINGRVYLRRPGPESAEPATPEEWRDIFTRCLRANRDDLLDAMRDILSGQPGVVLPPAQAPLRQLTEFADDATERWANRAARDAHGQSRLPPGSYRLAYAVQGDFARPSLPDLLRHLEAAQRPNTGWPEWVVINRDPMRPRVIDGGLEALVADRPEDIIEDPAHSDFWRATPDGRLALIRGFQEDAPDRPTAGTGFDIALPIWRVGECLLHAKALCDRLGVPGADVLVTARYSGLAQRRLVSLDGSRMKGMARRSAQNAIDLSVTVNAALIEDALPEIAREFLQPLYHLFDLFEPPAELFTDAIRGLRARG